MSTVTESTIPKEKHIEYVLKHFDFRRVQLHMMCFGLTWASTEYILTGKPEPAVPTIEQLKEHAQRVMMDAYEPSVKRVQAGMFEARVEGGYVNLAYIVEDYDSRLVQE